MSDTMDMSDLAFVDTSDLNCMNTSDFVEMQHLMKTSHLDFVEMTEHDFVVWSDLEFAVILLCISQLNLWDSMVIYDFVDKSDFADTSDLHFVDMSDLELCGHVRSRTLWTCQI